jgi:hypothetical protein
MHLLPLIEASQVEAIVLRIHRSIFLFLPAHCPPALIACGQVKEAMESQINSGHQHVHSKNSHGRFFPIFWFRKPIVLMTRARIIK